jgi:acylphosphatase
MDKTAQSAPLRVHVIVSGMVQGVGFRYFVVRVASRKGIVGWVRNRLDDTVEVLAEGTQAALADLLAHLRTGPENAQVADLRVAWGQPTGEFARFEVRRD